jgi:FixJ family two-component response regulator
VPARSIAVVDDDDEVRASLARLLRARGFAVRAYGSAEEFLVRPREEAPDCLVLDIRLAGMTGIDLRQRLLERGVRTPVVFITALDDVATVERIRAEAICLLKPVEDTALLDAIAGAIERGDT